MVPKPADEDDVFIPSDIDEDVDMPDTDNEQGDDDDGHRSSDALSLSEYDSDEDDLKAAAKAATSTKFKVKPAKQPFKLIRQSVLNAVKSASKKKVLVKVPDEDTSNVKIVAPPRCSHNKKTGPDDHSRLLDTTLSTDDGRIHMVFAVTQKLLNNRLKYLWASEPKMQVIDVELSNRDVIHSFLLPPQLHLEVEANRLGAAVFYINFDYGGFVALNDGPEYQKVWTDGWVLAFDVDITNIDITS